MATEVVVQSSLRAEDVCSILEAGAKFGVREITFAGLHVLFGQSVESRAIGDSPEPAPIPADLSANQHRELAKTELLKEEIQTREDQLAELLVTDPLAYEELLRNGDLADEPAGHHGDEIDDGPGFSDAAD